MLRPHTTDELEAILNEPIPTREPLHAWPLSSVERLTTASGARWIYKVQAEPTVEPEFLTRGRSPLLPPCRILRRDPDQAALLFPYLDAPTLRDAALDTDELTARGREIVEQIGQIAGDVPVYRDLGTIPAWRTFVAETQGMLAALVADGRFPTVTPDDLEFLARWCESAPVLTAIDTTAQIVHGDMKVEHVFRFDDGYRIIDWQRPLRAPGDIDLALLLESAQIDPRGIVAPAVLGLRWFVFLHWASEAKAHLLPHLPFFDVWARGAIDHIRSTVPASGS